MAATADLLELPVGTLSATRLTREEVKVELAVLFYAQGRLSLGKAGLLAGMSRWQFQHLLAARGVTIHLDAEDVDKDMATLRRLGRL